MSGTDSGKLRQEITELGPWHIEIEIIPGVSSSIGRDSGSLKSDNSSPALGFISPRDAFTKTLHTIYPQGLELRSFLDCGCNCGAFCFWAKELGAGRTLGLDARGHWIRQALLIQKYRDFPQVEFREMDIYDLSKFQTPRFDITLFRGLFHLLPEPMRGLKIAADLTREVLIFNTPVINVIDPEPYDGCLFLAPEPNESLTQGVHNLNWYPSGPNILLKLMEWSGFPHVKLHYYAKGPGAEFGSTRLRGQKKGDVQIIAARKPELLARLGNSQSVETRAEPQSG